eukprot:11295763-Karenia_brevis.AAC.1
MECVQIDVLNSSPRRRTPEASVRQATVPDIVFGEDVKTLVQYCSRCGPIVRKSSYRARRCLSL